MEKLAEVPEYRIRLPESAIANLMGLALTEYLALSHKPLEAFKDITGKIVEFYIHVSSNNDPKILDKLNLDSSNFVRFKPEMIYGSYV